MDRSILRLMPLLVQAAAALGQRSFNVSTKTLVAQMDFARTMLPLPGGNDPTHTAGTDPLLHRIDSTREHLRHIADIVSQETRGLESDFAIIAERARSLADHGEDGQTYRRRWKAKP
jgi:hypothetical protein